MKKIFTVILCSILVFFSHPAAAKIWRVNHNPAVGADFTDINSAINAAAPGDTIHIEGTLKEYNGFSCNKKLVFIGTGYFLSDNPETQANPFATRIGGTQAGITVGTAIFAPGSDGSTIMGMDFGIPLEIQASAITIARNDIESIRINGLGTGSTLGNIKIIQNYIRHVPNGAGGDLFAIFDLNSPLTPNLLISNNICSAGIQLRLSVTANIVNNIARQIIASNSLIINNIVTSQNLTVDNLSDNDQLFDNIYYNGISISPDIDGNFAADPATIFLNFPAAGFGGPDNGYQLSSNSPAVAKGVNGVDCGAFGGGTPYILSGMPPVPSIYLLTAPTALTSDQNTMKVTIGIKSHN